MVLKEGSPSLRWRFPIAQIFTHAGFGDIDTKFQQYSMNARSTPDIFSQLMVRIRSRTPFGTARPRVPRRIFTSRKGGSLSVPAHDRRDFDAGNASLPIVPDGAQPSPQGSIWCGELGPLHRALKDAELMAKRDDLQLKRRPASECIQHRRQKRREHRPVRKTSQDRQLPIYQSDQSFGDPQ